MVKRFVVLLAAISAIASAGAAHAARDLQKDFDDMTAAEKTKARALAKKLYQDKQITALRVCGDPGNMPLSTERLEGFQNKIMEVLGTKMGAKVSYFWRPYLERGITRQTFDDNECDLLMDMPSTYGGVLTTTPIYRTTYVLAYRSDRGLDIKSLDDPKLKDLKIGVFQTSAMREVLQRRGLASNLTLQVISHDGDLRPEGQPWRQVQQVLDGKLDVAAVWGPFAGWLAKMKGEPLVIQPANLMEDVVPLEFELSIGVRQTDALLKFALEWALEDSAAEVTKILTDFGVPLIQCSRCIVAGIIPSHGSYTARIEFEYKPKPEAAAADQIVSTERLETWLSEGADLNDELANAVLAGAEDRIALLVKKGGDINARDSQGYSPLHIAARNRRASLVKTLVGLGAKIDAPDADGMTPLLHAALRNSPPTVAALLGVGAKADAPGPKGVPMLSLVIEEGRWETAKLLIEAGAPPNVSAGDDRITPLMAAASQVKVDGPPLLPGATMPIDLARALVERGAYVNASSKSGVTALMIAAARNSAAMIGLLAQAGAKLDVKSREGKTALDVAQMNGNDAAARALKLAATAVQQN